MKKILWLIIGCALLGTLFGCSSEQVDLNKAVRSSEKEEKQLITREEAIKIALNHPKTKDLQIDNLALVAEFPATEEEPVWELYYKGENNPLTYAYAINGYTGELMSLEAEEHAVADEEALEEEMLKHVQWTFENWQSFHYESYDPSRYGLAFAINFRLSYLFDNYEENVKFVKENKIISDVKIKEIKDVGMSFSEEDETMYAQIRLNADYQQKIGGESLQESVEVYIFSKKDLHADEGWQITNVDIHPLGEKNTTFDRLFFGFHKTS